MCSIAPIAQDYSRPASCTAQWRYQPDSNPPLFYRQLSWNTPSTTTSASTSQASGRLSGLPSLTTTNYGPFIDSASDACLPPTATTDCAFSYAANACLEGYTAVHTSTVLLVDATLPQTVRFCCPTEAPGTKFAAGPGNDNYILCNATPNQKFSDVATYSNGSDSQTLTAFAGVQYAAAMHVMYEVGAAGLYSNAASVGSSPSPSETVTGDTPTHIGSLSVGGAVAIFVVLGVAIVSGVVLFLWYWRRKRRRALHENEDGENKWAKAELHGDAVDYPEADAMQRVELKEDRTGLKYTVTEMDSAREVGELDSPRHPVELPTDRPDRRSAQQI